MSEKDIQQQTRHDQTKGLVCSLLGIAILAVTIYLWLLLRGYSVLSPANPYEFAREPWVVVALILTLVGAASGIAMLCDGLPKALSPRVWVATRLATDHPEKTKP